MTASIILVGAGLAGGRAAEALRKLGYDGRLIMIGDEPVRPYRRPPLSKELLLGEIEAGAVFLRPENWYAEREIELILGRRATRLGPAGILELDDGSRLGFDACLLATGGRPRRLRCPGADLNGVVYLRTLDDAVPLAERLRSKPRVVVVGFGFIGAEVAAGARSLGCEVTILELLDRPMARALPGTVGGFYERAHRDHGVDVRLGEGVERIEGAGRAEAVVTTSGARHGADLVVVGVGIEQSVELAAGAGLECADGIVVDEFCRTSAERVWAAGDVASTPNRFLGHRARLEHDRNAQNQGAAAAANMLGAGRPFVEVPWFWSDQYDLNLQTLGHVADDDETVLRGSLDEGTFALFALRDGRMAGAVFVNRPHDVAPTRRLIERGTPVARAALRDENVALKELL